jgi:hypothetical protein
VFPCDRSRPLAFPSYGPRPEILGEIGRYNKMLDSIARRRCSAAWHAGLCIGWRLN